MGLLGAVSRIDPALILKYEYGSYKGYVAENFTAQEFHAAGIPELFCWEGRTSEVEFLLETSSGIIPVEVKSETVSSAAEHCVKRKKCGQAGETMESADLRGRTAAWITGNVECVDLRQM